MKYPPHILAAVFAVAGALLFVSIFGKMSFRIDAFEAQLAIQVIDHGFTQVTIPPVGLIRAKTHAAPLKLNITLNNIDLDLLKKMFKDIPGQEALVNKVKGEFFKALGKFFLLILGLSLTGGAFGMLILWKKNLLDYLKGALTGLVVIGVLLANTYFTYDINRFQQPEYEGILKAAPWMIGFAEQGLVKVNTLGKQLQVMANNLYDLFERIDHLEPIGAVSGDLKILHVSDFHNNPVALDFIEQVTRSFQPDMIIDTGDITDFGSPLETQLINRLAQLKVPYLFIPGNHDSPTTIEDMRAVPNVTVIEKGLVEVKGLKILGLRDPASLTNNIQPPPGETIAKYIATLKEFLKDLPEKPDILAVHNPRIATKFMGRVPIILSGHTHHFTISGNGDSVYINAGTTGAAGLRGLQAKGETPYSLVLLHFSKKAEEYRLLAVDVIRVSNLHKGFILERKFFSIPSETTFTLERSK